ncbi:MAG: nucleotide exchange factor GrpE [Lachnospiraceae bacterium]|nr:nucleotide exchange factor GrpE [Lachnospiraceae bacterium]
MVNAKELEDEVKNTASEEVNESPNKKAEGERTSEGVTESCEGTSKAGSEEKAGSKDASKADSEEVKKKGEAEDPSSEDSDEADNEEVSEEDDEMLFKKKKDKKDEQIAELKDRVMRQMAEFDNFRKRTEKEKSQMFDLGAKDIIEKILPVVDSFERGLASVKEEDKEQPFVQGFEKIYKQMLTTLEACHITPMDAAGKEFNPDLHNAVMHVEDENYGENIVVEELQKGYMYKDSVVRHAMVKVAN